MTNKDSKKPKTKNILLVRIIFWLFELVFFLLLAFVIWSAFCMFDKTDITKIVPKNYSLYVRTDSLWDSVMPLLELEAADVILAETSLSNFREQFLSIKESKYLDSKIIQKALSRRIDATMYGKNNYLLVLETGFLSGITRLLPIVSNFYSIPNLFYINAGAKSHFEYKTKNLTIYIKILKNLIICATNENTFYSCLNFNHAPKSLQNQIDYFADKTDKTFRIVVNNQELLKLISVDNQYVKLILNILSKNNFSTVDFDITNNNIDLALNVPLEITPNNKDLLTTRLLTKDSTVPEIIEKIPARSEYYTILNLASLSELVEIANDFLKPKIEINKLFATGNKASQLLFGTSLDDILYSWTGRQFAAIGIADSPDLVFALKINDEEVRKQIFTKLSSSLVLTSNDNLIVDGHRISILAMPSFLNSILKSFDINLPKPYFIVIKDYIYFSMSAKNLAILNADLNEGKNILTSDKYQNLISSNSKNKSKQETSIVLSPSSVNVYYNLHKSVPTFLRSNSIITKIIKLYNSGLATVVIKNNTIYFSLNAKKTENKANKLVSAYPIYLDGKTDNKIIKSGAKNSDMVFFITDNKILSGINLKSLKTTNRLFDSEFFIVSTCDNQKYFLERANSSNNQTDKNSISQDAALWLITTQGEVFLLSDKLENIKTYNLSFKSSIKSCPVAYKDGILVVKDNNEIVFINALGSKTQIMLSSLGSIISSPNVCQNIATVYSKSFTGQIFVIDNLQCTNQTKPIFVDGIGFGSPANVFVDESFLTSFINQNGTLFLWNNNGNLYNNFPQKLDGIFYVNVKMSKKYIFAISEDGTLSRIDFFGNKLSINIPDTKFSEGWLELIDYNNDGIEEVFVCGQGNTVYGFTENLEFANGFPLSGYSKPIFIDVNADTNADCLVKSIDNKLYAWNY